MSGKTILFYTIASSLLGCVARAQNPIAEKISISECLKFEEITSLAKATFDLGKNNRLKSLKAEDVKENRFQ